eukprot:Selendium_serpulae@DN5142_c0_g2_i1.p1
MKSGFLLGSALESKLGEALGEAPELDESGKLTLAHFRIEQSLGTGNYSEVFLATERATGKEFAIKILNKATVERKHKQNEILMEKRCLLRLSEQPNSCVVRLHHTFKDKENLYLVYDYCAGGELWEKLIGWAAAPRVWTRSSSCPPTRPRARWATGSFGSPGRPLRGG